MADHFNFHHANSSSHSNDESENRRLSKEISRLSDKNNEKIDQLESKLEKLCLVTEALWEIVKASGVEESVLVDKIEEVRHSKAAKKKEKIDCSGCGMTVPAVNVKCMYCGEQIHNEVERSVFEI